MSHTLSETITNAVVGLTISFVVWCVALLAGDCNTLGSREKMARIQSEPARVAACKTACGEKGVREVTRDGCECQ